MRLGYVRAEGAGVLVHAWGSRGGLVAVHLGEVPAAGKVVGGTPVKGIEIVAEEDFLPGLGPAIERYLSGEPLRWDGAIDWRGVTAFQREVYEAVRRVPHGGVTTYSDVSRRIGRPQSERAVGNALHRNPFALVVPCHRVLREGGGLGGFAGGVSLKRRLLELESGQIELEWNGEGT